MARIVKCPHCGGKGQVAPIDRDEKAFGSRGRFQGKPVMICFKCGKGMFIGFFSGLMLGQPKAIPAPLWAAMKENWQKNFGEPIGTQ